MSQQELFKAQTTWFHVFKSMIDSGEVAEMGPNATTVYLVIKAYANMSSGVSFPSKATIEKASGMSKKTVERAIATLVKFGYIEKQKKGRNNVYTLREKIPIVSRDGSPHSIATLDYVPSLVREATAELKNYLLTGEKDGKVVYIERVMMNVQINNGEATGSQFNLPEKALEVLDAPARKAVIKMMQEKRGEKK